MSACAALLAGCGAPCAGPGVICRLAGTGAAIVSADGKAATETPLCVVTAVRRGPDGLVYVMDNNSYRLRVIRADGTLATVAGNAEHATALDDVPATQSPLENPVDFVFGPAGEIYLVSYHDPRVLRVSPDGRLRAVVGSGLFGDAGDGGPAREASFQQLSGIAIADDGRLFVADEISHRVRVISADGQRVDAYAGTGTPGHTGDGGPATAATLESPSGLALDATGALYIADTGNDVVRRVRPDGVIETFAGGGTAGEAGDSGPATSAQLGRPEGVALDAAGNLYIADTANHRIRRVDPSGTITTFAGTGRRGLEGDGGPAIEAALSSPARLSVAADVLYISDQRTHTARDVQLR
jgi:sugar lactone lactonase YvrE